MFIIKVIKTSDDVNELAKKIKEYLDQYIFDKDTPISITQVCCNSEIITTIVVQKNINR